MRYRLWAEAVRGLGHWPGNSERKGYRSPAMPPRGRQPWLSVPPVGRLVKGRLNARLMIIEGKRREAELRVSASTAARLPNGSLRKWSINRCLVVTTAHKARSMRGNRSN
jgi:hypothetical protein